MKRKIVFLTFLITCFAYSNTIGLGGNLGTINGIKFSIPKKDKMYDLTLSYDLDDDNNLLVTGDYLIKNIKIEFLKDLPFWYGLQIKLDFDDETNISIQPKGELLYPIPDFDNLQLFTSISPGLQILPKTNLDLDFSLGFLYFFKLK